MKTIEQIRKTKLKNYGHQNITFYMSGKISGLAEYQYTQNFHSSGYYLVISHFFCGADKIISPLHLMPFLGIKSWLFYMITDIANLIKSDAVVFQSNWTESKGAKVEMWFALLFNKFIILQ